MLVVRRGRPVRRNQLPCWSMAQDDGLFAELQIAVGPGRQVHGLHRHLRGQAQGVGRVAAAGDDGFVPQLREGREGLLRRWRARPEFGGHRLHVDALANSEQLSVAGEARKGLIDGGSCTQAQQDLGA